jgi:hypothetical protein
MGSLIATLYKSFLGLLIFEINMWDALYATLFLFLMKNVRLWKTKKDSSIGRDPYYVLTFFFPILPLKHGLLIW